MKIFLIFIFVWKCLYMDVYIFVVYFFEKYVALHLTFSV